MESFGSLDDKVDLEYILRGRKSRIPEIESPADAVSYDRKRDNASDERGEGLPFVPRGGKSRRLTPEEPLEFVQV